MILRSLEGVKQLPRAHEPEQQPKAEDKPKPEAKGRRCSNEGCDAPLSVWNHGSTCHACELKKWEKRTMGVYSIAELMEAA